jgi:DnaJ-class molecular chaperone
VNVTVEVPRKLNREQRELIARLGDTENHPNEPIQKKILEKVKEIFG